MLLNIHDVSVFFQRNCVLAGVGGLRGSSRFASPESVRKGRLGYDERLAGTASSHLHWYVCAVLFGGAYQCG